MYIFCVKNANNFFSKLYNVKTSISGQFNKNLKVNKNNPWMSINNKKKFFFSFDFFIISGF